MATDIIVVGSLNMDFAVSVPQIPTPGQTVLGHDVIISPGGKGANQACAAARLGGRTAMIGKVGRDFLGEQLRQNLEQAGVDVACLWAAEPGTSTGIALISIDSCGRNAIAVAAGANRRLSVSDLKTADHLFAQARLLLVQLEIPIDTVLYALQRARVFGLTTILDPAPAQLLPPEVLTLVDVLTPNETEARILLGQEPGPMSVLDAEKAALALQSHGASAVVIKLGDKGAWLRTREGLSQHFPAYEVRAVDTTAAGDVFNGALAVALCDGRVVTEAVQFANAAAALSTTRRGAQASVPERSEVEQLVARSGGNTW